MPWFNSSTACRSRSFDGAGSTEPATLVRPLPQFIPVLGGIRVPRPDGGRPRCRPDRVLTDKRFIVTDTAGLLFTVTVLAGSWQDRDGAKTAAGRLVDWARDILRTTNEIVRKSAD